MAKRMNYTDNTTGVLYNNTVWLPLGIYIDFSKGDVKLDFLGYINETCATDVLKNSLGFPNITTKQPIGIKSYTLTKDEFAQLSVSPPSGKNQIDSLSNACYSIAMARLDTPDSNNPQTLVSFFHNAQDIILDIS